MKHVAMLGLLILAGCGHKPVPQTHVYTDTPQGRTASYVHQNCHFSFYTPGRLWWNEDRGVLIERRGDTLYSCPKGIEIIIRDDEEQP